MISRYPQRVKAMPATDPGVDVLVLSDDFNDAWVQVDGTAEVLDMPDALEPLVEYFRVISGEHPNWDEYRAAMVRQGKCLIRVTIEPLGTGRDRRFPTGPGQPASEPPKICQASADLATRESTR